MSNILVAFGLSWMVVAAFIGLYLGAKQESHLKALETASLLGDLAEFHRTFAAYKWGSSVHAHSMLFSLSAIVIGIELPQTGYGARTIKLLVAVFITAIIVWTLSGLKQMRWVMGLCDLVFVAVIIMTAWGVATR
jgi:hypothetical protein